MQFAEEAFRQTQGGVVRCITLIIKLSSPLKTG
jgi:hypothetical protein